MVKETGLYDSLGIAPDATEQQIKSAYRKMALKYHPDKNEGSAEAAEKFKEVAEAYEILSDPEKRKIYDSRGKASATAPDGQGGGAGFAGATGMRPEDIFASFFGGGARGQRATKPRDLLVEIDVSLEECYCGTHKTVRVRRQRKCSDCRGTGNRDGKERKCGYCNGQGVRMVRQVMGNMAFQRQAACQNCAGTGKQPATPSDRCQGGCDENGIRPDFVEVRVQIEPGAENGDSYRFEGKGHDSHDFPETGDVLVVLDVVPHPHYKRLASKHLVILNVNISLMHALLGEAIPVELPDGTIVSVSPADGGSLSPQFCYALRGRGFPMKGSRERGDVYLDINVEFPKPSTLTAAGRAKIAEALHYQPPSTSSGASLSDYVAPVEANANDETAEAKTQKKKSKRKDGGGEGRGAQMPSGVHVQECQQQ